MAGVTSVVAIGPVPSLARTITGSSAGLSLLTVARCAPLALPRVHVAAARPVESVAAVAGVRLPPESAEKLRLMPATPFSYASRTRATIGCDNVLPGAPLCPAPDSTINVAAAPDSTVTTVLVAPASPVALRANVCAPRRVSTSESKVTMPATAATRVRPASTAPLGPVAMAIVTLSTNSVATAPNVLRTSATTGASVLPAVTVAAGCCVIAIEAGPVASEVAVMASAGTPAAVAVRVCVPTSVPSVQSTLAVPSESLTTESVEATPLLAAAAKATVTPAIGRPSVPLTRTRIESVSGALTGADCPPPASSVSEPARGAIISITVSAPPPAASATRMRAGPRLGSDMPLPVCIAVMVARSVSSEVQMTGASVISESAVSRAIAVSENGSPEVIQVVSGDAMTLVALAPGPL